MKRVWILCLSLMVIVACAPAPTATPIPPTATAVPPTATRVPATATSVPPTATAIPPTATATSVPLTATATRPASTATTVASSPSSPSANCAIANTLEDFIVCVVAKMPRRDTQGFVVPSDAVLSDWKQIASQMLTGKCSDITLPASLKNVYTVSAFTDKQNNNTYCVAFEVLDENSNNFIDRGWGTFIVNPKATRELSIQAPHPLADTDTDKEAIGIFKGTNARTYLLAGSHRDANTQRSTCSNATEGEADASHNATNLFQATSEALFNYYGASKTDWATIQWHGMAATTCPNVDAFFSYGVQLAPKPGDKILELRDNMQKRQSGLKLTVFGEQPSCNLYATENVTGRLLNGVTANQVCTLPASSYSGKFIHIEQKIAVRALVADWVAAINETWK